MKAFITTTLLFLSCMSFAQKEKNVPFEEKYFPNQIEAFYNAKKEFDKANHLFEHGRGQYKNALKHYLAAYNFNPDNAELNYKIGMCYISTIHKTKSASFFDRAYRLDPRVSDDILYELAEAHHLNEDWDTAIYWYTKYEVFVKEHSKFKKEQKEVSLKRCDKKIQECKYGIDFSANPIPVEIENLGPNINTEFSEFGPIISADESVMFYTSRRPGSLGVNVHEGNDHLEPEYLEDIYISFKQQDGTWSEAENTGHPLNTQGQDATVWISPDGHQMILYNSDNGGTLYQTELHGDKWSRPHKLDNHINSQYHETSATYSLDRKTVYFVSNREESNFGGYDIFNADGHFTHDIYYAEWDDEKERWGKAHNIGPKINTEYNERGVFMHPDGKTLYFSSEGHNSMGGYDIFKTELVDGEWTTPINLGYPVNGPDHDVYFVLNASGTTGYYSRLHAGGYGEKDIYAIHFLNEDTASHASTELKDKMATSIKKTTIIKGMVKDQATGKAVAATITITDNDKHQIVFTAKSNSNTGKYLLSLPSGSHYGISIEAEGYLFHSENFDIDSSKTFSEIIKDIELQKIEVGNKIVLKNIFFESRKDELTKESIPELLLLFELLEQNPHMEIEISGHTDNIGSDDYNLDLSNKRAKAVADFLVQKGVNIRRLKTKGYGETKPIADNESEEGRAKNRRTEFKIISN